MAVTEVMHDPHRTDVPERQTERALTRGGPCLICGDWIEPDAVEAYRVLVSNPPREGEYACHASCFDRIKHESVPDPS